MLIDLLIYRYRLGNHLTTSLFFGIPIVFALVGIDLSFLLMMILYYYFLPNPFDFIVSKKLLRVTNCNFSLYIFSENIFNLFWINVWFLIGMIILLFIPNAEIDFSKLLHMNIVLLASFVVLNEIAYNRSMMTKKTLIRTFFQSILYLLTNIASLAFILLNRSIILFNLVLALLIGLLIYRSLRRKQVPNFKFTIK